MDDCKPDLNVLSFEASKLETIDTAMLKWIRSRNIHVSTKEGFKKVPVVWASSERAFQTKNYANLRDETGTLILPVISVQRVSVERSLSKKLGISPNQMTEVDDYMGGGVTIAREINQEKSRNFANADGDLRSGLFRSIRCNDKIVYNTYTIPTPTYLNITYKVVLRSEYQQQMNTMVSPFVSLVGGINEFMIGAHGHTFPAFLEEQVEIADNIDNFSEEERKFEASMNIRVLGYIIGSDKNQAKPKVVRRESVVETRIPRERTLFGNLRDFEADYGAGELMGRFTRFCQNACPPDQAARAFGRAMTAASGSLDVASIKTIVNNRVAEIIIAREFLTPIGGGNLHFETTHEFKENSETVYWNGQLLMPGAANDYNAWDGEVAGKAERKGITLVDHSAGGDWDPPRTAAESNTAYNDVILISYIKA